MKKVSFEHIFQEGHWGVADMGVHTEFKSLIIQHWVWWWRFRQQFRGLRLPDSFCLVSRCGRWSSSAFVVQKMHSCNTDELIMAYVTDVETYFKFFNFFRTFFFKSHSISFMALCLKATQRSFFKSRLTGSPGRFEGVTLFSFLSFLKFLSLHFLGAFSCLCHDATSVSTKPSPFLMGDTKLLHEITRSRVTLF